MRKIVMTVLAVLIVAAIVVTGSVISGTTNSAAGSINVYNWGEYIDQSVLADFEEQTGIKVNYTTYASNKEMYAKIVSGAASYDVIVPSEYMLSKMIDEGLIDSFDLVSLVGELMDEFDVELTVEDLLPENFNSVDAIVELIARKR